jgi:uncharacterized protein (TIGR03663 family)
MALWIVVAVVAFALRLARLDAALLSGREAHEAILAWRAVSGQGMPGAGYSPLLFVANALLFALCGAGDGLARVWPALLGGALALTPLLFRQRIGRVGALAAGLYLALSPTALFASRQVDGTAMAAVGGMVFLAGLVRFFDTDRRAWLTLAAGGLGLAVASSSAVYGLLLALGLAWLGLAWAWPAPSQEEGGSGFRWLWELLRPHLGHALVVFVLVGLAFSTGLGWNPAGFGATGDLVVAWFARFGPASSPVASPFALLAVYEPLGLVFGLGGLAWGVRRGRRFSVLMGLWAAVGALLLALMPSRAALDVLWVVVPLALLTGVAVEQLAQSLRERGEWLGEGLYVPVVLVLWCHFYLMLAHYAVFANPADLALALLTVVLQGLLAVVFALTIRLDSALRAVAVGTGIVLLVATFSAGWGVAHVRPADPRELLVREPTAIEARDLVQTLHDLSWREMGIPTTLPFTIQAASDSVLAWYLRDFSAARRVESLGVGGEIGPVLVTSQRDLSDPMLVGVPGDVGYVGQDFVLRRGWDALEAGCIWEWPPRCEGVVKWLLFRNTPSPPPVERWAVLWQRAEVE